MLTLLTIVHLVIGVSLVLFVLLQDPKGGAMGVFSGGSSANSFFGSSGASNFLTTVTKWLAVLFAVSCLTLTYLTAKKSSSVMDKMAPTSALPATPNNVPSSGPADAATAPPRGTPVPEPPAKTGAASPAPAAPATDNKKQ